MVDLSIGRRGTAALVAIMLLSSVGVVAFAAGSAGTNVDPAADPAPNPAIEADLTKSEHSMAQWGTGDQGLLTYENNDGHTTQLPATVNRSADNPVTYQPSGANVSDFRTFVQGSSNWSNASQWSGPLAVSETTTAEGVPSLTFASNGSMTSGDVEHTTFGGLGITEDVNKRYLQLVLDVTTLDSGAELAVRLQEDDGDYKEAVVDAGELTGNTSVIANSTGRSAIYQTRVGDLSVQGSGDGTLSAIDKVVVRVQDADATVEVTALNVGRLSRYSFGDRMVDTDGDGAMESHTVYERGTDGRLSIHSLDSLGSVFDEATLHDLTVPVEFRASDLPTDDQRINASYDAADSYPSYSTLATIRYRLEVPAAYDISIANAEVVDQTELPSSRYRTVEFVEGASDTPFADLSYTSKTTTYDVATGTNVSLDSSATEGTAYAVKYTMLLTDQEKQDIKPAVAGGGGGGGGAAETEGSGPLDALFSIPGMIVSGVLGFLGIRVKRG